MQQWIAQFGYAAVLMLMIAESACIPVPAEVTMLFAGALAGGAIPGAQLNLAVAIAAGTVGNVAGSYLAWAAGRYGGPAALRPWGRYLRLRQHDLDRAHAWFTRHGAISVFVGRLLPVVRTFISLPAGIAAMAPLRFGIYTLAGCLPFTAALAVAGYALGNRWHNVVNAFHTPTYIIAAAVGILLLTGLYLLLRRRTTDSLAAHTRDPIDMRGERPLKP